MSGNWNLLRVLPAEAATVVPAGLYGSAREREQVHSGSGLTERRERRVGVGGVRRPDLQRRPQRVNFVVRVCPAVFDLTVDILLVLLDERRRCRGNCG